MSMSGLWLINIKTTHNNSSEIQTNKNNKKKAEIRVNRLFRN